MSLAQQDDVLLVAPSRSFVLEYDQPVYFWRWQWARHCKTRITLRTLPLLELQQIQRIYAQLEKDVGLNLTVALAVIVGRVAYYLTQEQLVKLWDAHCQLNLIPKVEAPEEAAKSASPTPPSSGASNAGPSSTNESESYG